MEPFPKTLDGQAKSAKPFKGGKLWMGTTVYEVTAKNRCAADPAIG